MTVKTVFHCFGDNLAEASNAEIKLSQQTASLRRMPIALPQWRHFTISLGGPLSPPFFPLPLLLYFSFPFLFSSSPFFFPFLSSLPLKSRPP